MARKRSAAAADRYDALLKQHPLREAVGQIRRSFFEREYTESFINAVADADALTVFAGAGISADYGMPLNEDLMPELLGQFLNRRNDLKELGITEADHRGVIAELAQPTALLGSMVREENRQQAGQEQMLVNMVKAALQQTSSGGLTTRGVTALAYSAKDAGRDVMIVTTNFDANFFSEARSALKKHLPFLDSYNLYKLAWPSAEASAKREMSQAKLFAEHEANAFGEGNVPVFYANGLADESDALVLSEFDFLAHHLDSEGETDEDGEPTREAVRERIISTRFSKSDVLFVGSSVTDPDVLQKLVETAGSKRYRFAVLLAPDLKVEQGGSEADRERSLRLHVLRRALMEARFRQLGIIPITVDFPSQVPQLLREIALRIQTRKPKSERPAELRKYPKRANDWWSTWQSHFGHTSSGPRKRSILNQAAWHLLLQEERDKQSRWLNKQFTDGPNDRLKLELWIRNPKARNVFLWSTSESRWIEGDSAHAGPINIDAESHWVSQSVFRNGHSLGRAIDHGRGHWKYVYSFPLILQLKPFYHLPIGVVNVVSDRRRPNVSPDSVPQFTPSKLQQLAEFEFAPNDESVEAWARRSIALERALKKRLLDVLSSSDPDDALRAWHLKAINEFAREIPPDLGLWEGELFSLANPVPGANSRVRANSKRTTAGKRQQRIR